MDSKKCECGSSEFYASQRSYHKITTNEHGVFIDDMGIFQSDNPYGPFICTKCGREYETLEPHSVCTEPP